MNNVFINLKVILKNPHLRYCVIGLALLEIAAVWFPNYKQQIAETQKIIGIYLVAVATNSTGDGTGDTQFINKPKQ